MTCLPVRDPSVDGELFAFLERINRGSGLFLGRQRRSTEADGQNGRDAERHDAHDILLELFADAPQQPKHTQRERNLNEHFERRTRKCPTATAAADKSTASSR